MILPIINAIDKETVNAVTRVSCQQHIKHFVGGTTCHFAKVLTIRAGSRRREIS
jgi:hypothetical protein